jgi:hypothetical protein
MRRLALAAFIGIALFASVGCKKSHPESQGKSQSSDVNLRRSAYIAPEGTEPDSLRVISKEEASAICGIMDSLAMLCETPSDKPIFTPTTKLTSNAILHCAAFNEGAYIMTCLQYLTDVAVTPDQLSKCQGLNEEHLNCLSSLSGKDYE